MDSTDWPTTLTPPSSSVVSGGRGVAGGEGGGGDVVITPQDNLESVLERVGLVEHQSLFKVGMEYKPWAFIRVYHNYHCPHVVCSSEAYIMPA